MGAAQNVLAFTPVDLQTGALSLMKDLLYALELHPISRDGVLFRTGAFS